MDCDEVDDVDNVDGLESCYCFGFGEEVIGEAAVVVIVGDSGLTAAKSVIGDKIHDDDDDYDDIVGIVVLFEEIISQFSFYIIYIIIINKNENKNTYHDDWDWITNNYLNIFIFICYYNINYIKREWRYSPKNNTTIPITS